MSAQSPAPSDLVLTQAESVPAPRAKPQSGSMDPQVVADIQQLADRVGGLDQLADLVQELRQCDSGRGTC